MTIKASTRTLTWAPSGVPVVLRIDPSGPVAILSWGLMSSASSDRAGWSDHQPLVEVVAVGAGLGHGGPTYEDSRIGRRLRYVSHEISADTFTLEITQEDAQSGLEVTSVLRSFEAVSVLRCHTRLVNKGFAPVRVQAVSSLAVGIALEPDACRVVTGAASWTAEGRWNVEPLRASSTVQYRPELHGKGHPGGLQVSSVGTWSTGRVLSTGGLLDDDRRAGLMWQIEHNGPWQYQITERPSGVALVLLGPTDLESHWAPELASGDAIETVPVALVQAAGGLDAVAAEMTRYRRSLRGGNALAVAPMVFNDFMNTLMGDPTTEKLLPLIEAAAEVGAEYFCIDAGWYDDGGTWWDSVGEWIPSATRFPGGLGIVMDHIRGQGMVPGLWLEPEVIGIRSPLADELPGDAFITRGGERVEQNGRYLLDFRSEAVISHLDAVVDRLVGEYQLGFFKFDYNSTPGAGSDAFGLSAGEGLLAHNRAFTAWIDGVQRRHPFLIIENCGSGGMRMDYAMLSRLDLQSTSDQQDPLLYPPIAASAGMSMIPEQAANWSYPQPGMSRERSVFTLATGMLGSMYLSGYLNKMDAPERDLVTEAVAIHKALRPEISRSTPMWPLGLPLWDADRVAMALATSSSVLATIWERSGIPGTFTVPFPHLAGRPSDLTAVFPVDDDSWSFEWSPAEGVLTVSTKSTEPSARVLRIILLS